MGLIKMEKKIKKYNKWGYNINGVNRRGFDRNGYNINGYNISGYDTQHYNINIYNTNGYDSQHYNINGYNYYGIDRRGYRRKALKKNIPGSGLKILTPQQMFTRLPILIRQLLYSLYGPKKISKTVYKNLISAI